MATEQVKFDLGFVGGGSATGMAPLAEWERLEAALQNGGSDAVLRLDVQDGILLVRPSQVAYARRNARERSVGF
jgi:hypothetical protein